MPDGGLRLNIASVFCLLALLLALPADASAVRDDAVPPDPPDSGEARLQVFRTENPLLDWVAYGLRDARGRIVVPATREHLTPLPGGGWLRGGGYGGGELLDAGGRRLAGPFTYIVSTSPELDVVIAGPNGAPDLEGGQGLMLRGDGQVIAGPLYALKYLEGTGLFSFQRARRTGVMDAQGRTVLEPLYDGVEPMQEKLLVRQGDQVALFDGQGRNLSGFRGDTSYSAMAGMGLIRVCNGASDQDDFPAARCRVMDGRWHPAIPGEFSRIDYLPEIQRWIAAPYRSPGDEDSGETAGVDSHRDRLYLLLDEQGRRVAGLQAMAVRGTEAKRLLVTVDNPEEPYGDRQGLMDRDGRWLSRPESGALSVLPVADAEVHDGVAAAPQFLRECRNADGSVRSSVIDADGQVVLPPFDGQIRQRFPSLDLYVVEHDERGIGVLDSRGRWRIEPRRGFIMNAEVPLPYLLVSGAQAGADGKTTQRATLHDLRDGRSVFRGQYEHLQVVDRYWPLYDRKLAWPEFVLFNARRDGKYGVIDLEENVRLPFQYEAISYIDDWGNVYAFEEGHEPRRIPAFSGQSLVRLHQRLSRLIREQQAPLPSDEMPGAGRYVPLDYRAAHQVAAAAARGELSRPIAPMMLVSEREAVLDLEVLRRAGAPPLPDRTRGIIVQDGGFDILLRDQDVSSSSSCGCAGAQTDVESDVPRLSFRQQPDGVWACETCAAYGLPQRWWRTDPSPDPALP